MEGHIQYPKIQLDDYQPQSLSHLISEEMEDHRCKSNIIPKNAAAQDDRTLLRKCESEVSQPDTANNGVENVSKTCHSKQGKVFFL